MIVDKLHHFTRLFSTSGVWDSICILSDSVTHTFSFKIRWDKNEIEKRK